MLKQFKQLHPCLSIKFQAKDWPILLAYVQRESVDEATELARFNANNMMLSGISLSLLALALIQAVEFVYTLFVLHLILAIILAVSSIIAVKESVKFAQWFYFGIFQAITSRSLQASHLVEHKQEVADPDG